MSYGATCYTWEKFKSIWKEYKFKKIKQRLKVLITKTE